MYTVLYILVDSFLFLLFRYCMYSIPRIEILQSFLHDLLTNINLFKAGMVNIWTCSTHHHACNIEETFLQCFLEKYLFATDINKWMMKRILILSQTLTISEGLIVGGMMLIQFWLFFTKFWNNFFSISRNALQGAQIVLLLWNEWTYIILNSNTSTLSQ